MYVYLIHSVILFYSTFNNHVVSYSDQLLRHYTTKRCINFVYYYLEEQVLYILNSVLRDKHFSEFLLNFCLIYLGNVRNSENIFNMFFFFLQYNLVTVHTHFPTEWLLYCKAMPCLLFMIAHSFFICLPLPARPEQTEMLELIRFMWFRKAFRTFCYLTTARFPADYSL